jgi:hypothetical protein
MARFEDPYYRCPKCGNGRFKVESEYAVIKDPEPFSHEALDTQMPTMTKPIYKLFCSFCGEQLDRYGMATGKIKPFNNSMLVPKGMPTKFTIKPEGDCEEDQESEEKE